MTISIPFNEERYDGEKYYMDDDLKFLIRFENSLMASEKRYIKLNEMAEVKVYKGIRSQDDYDKFISNSSNK